MDAARAVDCSHRSQLTFRPTYDVAQLRDIFGSHLVWRLPVHPCASVYRPLRTSYMNWVLVESMNTLLGPGRESNPSVLNDTSPIRFNNSKKKLFEDFTAVGQLHTPAVMP